PRRGVPRHRHRPPRLARQHATRPHGTREHGTMRRTWTFGFKLGLGLAIMVVLTLILGGFSLLGVQTVLRGLEDITREAQLLVQAEQLNGAAERKVAAARGYLLAREPRFLEIMEEARERFFAHLDALDRSATSDDVRALVAS